MVMAREGGVTGNGGRVAWNLLELVDKTDIRSAAGWMEQDGGWGVAGSRQSSSQSSWGGWGAKRGRGKTKTKPERQELKHKKLDSTTRNNKGITPYFKKHQTNGMETVQD